MVEDTGLERYVVNLGAFLTSAGVSTRHSLLGVVRGCSWLFVVACGCSWLFVVVRGCSWHIMNSCQGRTSTPSSRTRRSLRRPFGRIARAGKSSGSLH